MLDTTVNLIKGVLATDATMDERSRGEFMQVMERFRSGNREAQEAKAPPQARNIPFAEAARRLGCSANMARYLVRKGLLTGVRLSGVRFRGVTEESLVALINGSHRRRRQVKGVLGRPKKEAQA